MCIVASDTYLATFTTDVGTFVVRMNAGRNPVAVNNFVFLARYRFYDGTEFHRVIPGFVVQGGDPTGTGTGGPGYSWTGNSPASSCASSKSCYPDYSVAYANSGSLSSNGSQFFIVLPGGGRQITPKYTLFGQVIAGASVVAHIGSLGGAGYTGIPVVVIHVHSVTITTQSD
ncbi:MAG TPA: peptidylprolyl isomerase [Acidimicrobiales bacterium]|nr:peptidylprolyl isomerase [Acidimicrobiales bacterium]